MKYLLDTDICISLLQGKFKIKEKIQEVGIDNCVISEITIAELSYGAEKSGNPEKHSIDVDKTEELFTVFPIYDILKEFAKQKVRLQKKGVLIPDFDLLIGSTAVHHELIMVTNNTSHMERLEGIKIENWRKQEFNRNL